MPALKRCCRCCRASQAFDSVEGGRSGSRGSRGSRGRGSSGGGGGRVAAPAPLRRGLPLDVMAPDLLLMPQFPAPDIRTVRG
jgi:hypothetical protein